MKDLLFFETRIWFESLTPSSKGYFLTHSGFTGQGVSHGQGWNLCETMGERGVGGVARDRFILTSQ